MKNGVLREDEGFDLMVDGMPRTFSDTEPGAYAVARQLKKTNRDCIIEIRTRSTQKRVIMGPDGRTL